MTVAFDAAASSSRVDNTAPWTWTHTPVGVPKAIVVGWGHKDTGNPLTSGNITYGGVAMALAREQGRFSGAQGYSALWFLGAGIPTGAQTISVPFSGSPTNDMGFVSMSFTANGDCEVVAVNSGEGNTANPSIAVGHGSRICITCGAIWNTRGFASEVGDLGTATRRGSVNLGGGNDTNVIVSQETVAGTADYTLGYTSAGMQYTLAGISIAQIVADPTGRSSVSGIIG